MHELFQSILYFIDSEIALLVGINLLKDLLKLCKVLFSGSQIGQQGYDASLEPSQLGESLDGTYKFFMIFWGNRLRIQL